MIQRDNLKVWLFNDRYTTFQTDLTIEKNKKQKQKNAKQRERAELTACRLFAV